MSIIVQCDCGKKYKLGDDKAGKKMRCKECNGVVAIPKPKTEPADEWDDFGDGGLDDFGGDDYGEPAPRPKSKSGSKAKGKGKRKTSAKPGGMSPVVKYSIAGGIVAVAVGIVVGILVMRGVRIAPATTQEEAIAEIHKLGGTVKIDEKSPGKPVIEVHLHKAKVTDDWLEHLKVLTKLEYLLLSVTKVNAGLVHLKGLNSLRTLTLRSTKITDAGLVHLKGLTEIRELDLGETKVTTAGVKMLNMALPKCKIFR